MTKQAQMTVRVRMKGCFQDLENGQEYDLPLERGTWLRGVGLADYVDIELNAPAPGAVTPKESPEVN